MSENTPPPLPEHKPEYDYVDHISLRQPLKGKTAKEQIAEMRERYGPHAVALIRWLWRLVYNDEVPWAQRIAACNMVLDRLQGKPELLMDVTSGTDSDPHRRVAAIATLLGIATPAPSEPIKPPTDYPIPPTA